MDDPKNNQNRKRANTNIAAEGQSDDVKNDPQIAKLMGIQEDDINKATGGAYNGPVVVENTPGGPESAEAFKQQLQNKLKIQQQNEPKLPDTDNDPQIAALIGIQEDDINKATGGAYSGPVIVENTPGGPEAAQAFKQQLNNALAQKKPVQLEQDLVKQAQVEKQKLLENIEEVVEPGAEEHKKQLEENLNYAKNNSMQMDSYDDEIEIDI